MLRRSLWAGAASVALLGSSCNRRPPPDQLVEDGWAVARASLTDGHVCFAGRAEYCITDPDFVDAAIKPRLEKLYGGEMPLRRAHVEAVILAAEIEYRKQTMRASSIEKIEALVVERYANPKITVNGDLTSIDMGLVPGALEARRTTNTLAYAGSGFVDSGEWTASEISRTLGQYVAAYPQAAIVRIAVTVPQGDQLSTYSYRYLKKEGRLIVTNGTGDMRTSKFHVELADLTKEGALVRFGDLHPCKSSRVAPGLEEDPPTLCIPDDEHPANRDPTAL
ncbi:MAG: hypothetical protein U0271_07880 [Polyangiaceae bacterium]